MMRNSVVTQRPLTPRSQIAITEQGLGGENFPRGPITASSLLTAQRTQGGLLGFRAGDVVTNLHCVMATTGSGAGYARMALYALDGTQRGVSGDANAAFTGTAGLLTVALSSAYTVTADGGLYVCVLANLATTQPTLSRGIVIAAGATAVGAGSLNFVQESSQASFPASASFSSTTIGYWFGWS